MGGRPRLGKAMLVGLQVIALSWAPVRVAAQQPRTGSAALLIETSGATVGSAAGFGLALILSRPGECGEDLGCILEKLGISVIVSASGAAAGDILAGRMAATRPSAPGAIVGSLAGIAAGAGVAHLLSEELDVTRNDAALFISYSLTQGIVTAIGSRIGAWLRVTAGTVER